MVNVVYYGKCCLRSCLLKIGSRNNIMVNVVYAVVCTLADLIIFKPED